MASRSKVPSDEEALKLMLEFADKNRELDCVIVQMPTADRFNFSVDMIPVNKDCDGLHPLTKVMPATVRGIIDYLDICEFDYSGKSATVIGRSEIVGKPMARALLERNMTVTQCHSKTDLKDTQLYASLSDLIVIAAGRPQLLSRINCPLSIVIDVSINRINGKLIGDFKEIEECKLSKDAWSTPVPGGVGLLTRLGLIKNCLDLSSDKQISIE